LVEKLIILFVTVIPGPLALVNECKYNKSFVATLPVSPKTHPFVLNPTILLLRVRTPLTFVTADKYLTSLVST
jgi:hypothetical protein